MYLLRVSNWLLSLNRAKAPFTLWHSVSAVSNLWTSFEALTRKHMEQGYGQYPLGHIRATVSAGEDEEGKLINPPL